MKFRFVKKTEPDGFVTYYTEFMKEGGNLWLYASGSLNSCRETAEGRFKRIVEGGLIEATTEVLAEGASVILGEREEA